MNTGLQRTIVTLALAIIGLCSVTYAQWTGQTSGVTNDLNGVHFINNNTGWIAGRQGTLLTTTNGGSTWSAQNSATTEDLHAIFMVSSTVGYAVGNKGKISKYNGTTWSASNTSETRDVFGVYFLDAETGWAVGDWGRLYRTTNGGSSWTNQNNDALASYKYNDVHMVDASNGWAVGTTGRIVKYNGTNWAEETSGVTVELLGVHFLNTNFGFAVGKSSTILFYNGSSWSPHNSGLGNTSDNIYDVHIVSENEAYAVVSPGFGGAGVILKFNGTTWSKEYEYSGLGTELFYGLHFPSASKGYAIGSGGMIKTKGDGVTAIDVNEFSGPIPDEFTLSQNYPNPFNPSTTIQFGVPERSAVTVEIYDLVGRLVDVLAEGEREAGTYQILWNADDRPTGVYFLRVSARSLQTEARFESARRIVLVK